MTRHDPPLPDQREASTARRFQVLENRIQAFESIFNKGYPWIPLTFHAGWENYGEGWQACAYSKDATGWVRFKGLAKNTAEVKVGANQVIAEGILPAEFQPGANGVISICMWGGAAGRVDVQGGTLKWEAGATQGAGSYLSLANIAYQAATA